jgi:AraC-like DNA-binding protein
VAEQPSPEARRVTVGEARYPGGTHLRTPETDDYTVAVPTHGASGVMHRGQEIDADVAHAAVTRPDAGTDVIGSDGYAVYSVTIGSGAVADVLEHRLGHSVQRAPDLATTLDLRTPAGHAWSELVRLLVTSPLLRHPVLAAPIQEAVTARLLFAVDHRYRDELDGPVASWGPGPVRRMVDAIEASPRHPYTLGELSDIAGVSVRALGACCRRHLDASPWQQLSSVRMASAHRELEDGDPGYTSVVAIASGWGFPDADRFNDDYGHRYGVPAWLTLRGPAYA